jgi:hypothetical protein
VFWLLFLTFLFSHPSFAVDPIVKITNYSSNSLPEWVEIHNQTSNSVNLNGWIIKDGNDISSDDIILDGCLSSGSYLTFYHQTNWLNNSGDTITLLDNTNSQIDQLVYTEGKTDNSPRSDNTCILAPTQTSTPSITPTNSPSFTPTLTPTSSVTRTPTPTHTPTPTKTPSPTPTNTTVPSSTPIVSLTPTVTVKSSPTPSSTIYLTPTPETIDNPPTPTDEPAIDVGDIIVVSPTPVSTPQKSLSSASPIAIIFIIIGSLLLVVPMIILKIKK